MNWLRNVKMKSKILFCFSLNAFLTVIVGLIAINYGDQLSQISLFTSIVIAAILLNLFLGLFLSGVIGRPLQNLIHSANNIAEGNFAVDLDVERQDEFGQLMTSFAKILTTTRNQAEAANKIASGDLDIHVEVKSDQDILSRSLKQVVETLRTLMHEMTQMSREHDAGDIDVFIPDGQFNGAYKTMAQGVNNMVKNHISVKKKAMACIAEFANGNFDADLEKFPGKKAFINDHIEGLRKNIKQFIAEMTKMSAEHDAGDIDVYLPEEEFQGDFRIMAQGVNTMVRGHINVKKKAMACIAEFANGNFDAELEKFPGKKAFINDHIEALRKNLKDVNAEIRKLIVASNEGKLSERANIELFHGDWAELMEGLNGLIDAILEPIQEAAVVLDEMAKGNLHVSVKGEYKGDHAKIKNSLNGMGATLSGYVTEIS